MSHLGVPWGTARTRRSLALLTTGVLAFPLLAGCDSGDGSTAGPDIAVVDRNRIADGGTVDWAVDALPTTLNAFQADTFLEKYRDQFDAMISTYRSGFHFAP
ncbi:hypothetical protein ACF08W_29485 [Streptomyces sp. NPDC015144]|uniref:hypothetical protein n=1 Tax=Streptomyces sp. NPDC015144 TaxID=3364944 RepID=UPI0036F8AFB1